MAKYKKAKKVGTKQEVSKRTIIIMALLITMGLAVFLGTSYAIFTLTLRGSKQVSIQVGTFQVDFENSQFIRLNNATGMSEEEGLQTTPYRFTITNSGDIKAYYNISLTDESAIGETTKLNTAYLHYNLIGPNGFNQSGIVGNTNGGLVSNQSLEPGVSDDYELRLWLDENTPNSEMGTTYQSKIAIESSQVETEMTAVNTLLAKANTENLDYNSVTSEQQKEMWTFSHEVGEQQTGWTSDELKDYRYIGNNPNNYIIFNNETWRIIGVFTAEDALGTRKKYIKLLRNESLLDEAFSWDSTSPNTTNEWSTSDLRKLLNPGYESEDAGGSLYYVSHTGQCRQSRDLLFDCDFKENGLKEESREQIAEVKWYLGSVKDDNNSALGFYQEERGVNVYSGNSINWIGKVGLIYPSDYAYTFANGFNSTCYENLFSCDTSTNSWMNFDGFHWTISPISDPYDHNQVVIVDLSTPAQSLPVSDAFKIHPVVFLRENIKITGGDGSSSNPYIIQ